MLVGYELLKTGIATLDRFAIRGSVAFWCWVEGEDPKAVLAIIHNESLGDPANYVGDNGASLGPGQVQYATFQDAGLRGDETTWATRNLPGKEYAAIHDVVRVWKWCRTTGHGAGVMVDDHTAFALYNGGRGGASSNAAQAYADKAVDFMAGIGSSQQAA
jgi:hypothetical protein